MDIKEKFCEMIESFVKETVALIVGTTFLCTLFENIAQNM